MWFCVMNVGVVRCSAVWYGDVQCSTVLSCVVQCGVVLGSEVCVVMCGAVGFGAVYHSLVWRFTVQCGAVQCRVVWCCAESALNVPCGDSLSPKVANRCLGSLHCTSLGTVQYMHRTGPISAVQCLILLYSTLLCTAHCTALYCIDLH